VSGLATTVTNKKVDKNNTEWFVFATISHNSTPSRTEVFENGYFHTFLENGFHRYATDKKSELQSHS